VFDDDPNLDDLDDEDEDESNLDDEEVDDADEDEDERDEDPEEDEQEPMSDLQKPEAQAIIETVERLGVVEFKEMASGVTVAVVPAGKQLVSVKKLIDEYRTAPDRKKGTARLNEPTSFIDHVNRMKDESTALFAKIDSREPSITAVYDYHQLDGSPRFGEHRAIYPFPLSEEWKVWSSLNGEKHAMDQKGFAEFIEDRQPDLEPPISAGKKTQEYVEALNCELATPGQIITLSRGLSMTVDHELVNTIRLGSGELQMVFKETHKGVNGEPLKIPGAFLISIPFFVGGQSWVIPVRLRYRNNQGTVVWWYQLALVDVLFREAIDLEIAKISEGVNLKAFIGTPEA
jgi:uncharacterized protein YfdQ (DUF2303 family)